MTRLRQEVRETIAANQTAFSGQIQQVGNCSNTSWIPSPIAYAISRRVVPVSPNLLYAYLQTILLGLNGLRLAENITTVLGWLSELQAALDRVEEDVQLVGKHLRNSLNRFQEAEGHLRAFRLQLSTLTQAEIGDEQQRNTGMD